MIVHHDELWMTPPVGGPAILAAVHVRAEVLAAESDRLAAIGWTRPEIIPCRACATHAPLVPIAA